jgi:phage shock protein A
MILDAADALIEAKKSVAVAIADERRLAKQTEVEDANAAEWEQRARSASASGDEALRREALVRQQEHLALAGNLRELWAAQCASVEKQKTALRTLNTSIERAKRVKNTVVARRSMDEGRRRIDEAVARVDETLRTLELLAHLDGALERAGRLSPAGTPAPDG